jgi:uncharacterized protein
MASHLDDIIHLQETLTELAAAQEQLSGIPDWMRELHEEHSRRHGEIEELEATVEAARGERRTAEDEIAVAQEHLKRYQQQINQVSTQREYGALLAEIDTSKAQISSAEERGIAAMERREEAERQLAAAREAFRDLDERYTAELAKWESEKPDIAARVERLEGAAEVLKERIPRGQLAQFERIRERHGGEGLAPIQEIDRGGRGPRFWHCGACNYSVRPQVVVEIRNHGSLVQCESCKRILYLPEEEGG